MCQLRRQNLQEKVEYYEKCSYYRSWTDGRGFIAPIVENNSYHLTFVDKDAELIEKMNQEKQYVINYFGETNKRRIIKNFDAFQINDEKYCV